MAIFAYFYNDFCLLWGGVKKGQKSAYVVYEWSIKREKRKLWQIFDQKFAAKQLNNCQEAQKLMQVNSKGKKRD